MRMHRFARLSIASFTLLTGTILFPGCQNGGADLLSTAESAIKGLTGDWDLSKLAGQDIASLLPAGNKRPFLNFAEDGRVTGFTGVNRLTSSLDLAKLAKGEFALAPAATTRMAGQPEAMKVESEFLQAISSATGYKLDGNTLSLTEKGRELLSFIKR
jgi:heat shock protein HslJ